MSHNNDYLDFYKLYKEKIIPEMMEEFKYKNEFLVPEIKKLTIDFCIDRKKMNLSNIGEGSKILSIISGQKPKYIFAKTSLSNFKLRKGMYNGAKVDLHRKKAYDFFQKVILFYLPRIKNFTGIKKKSISNTGVFSIGIKSMFITFELDLQSQLSSKMSFNISLHIARKNKKQATSKEIICFLKKMYTPING